jgi:ribosome maturation factor RimP
MPPNFLFVNEIMSMIDSGLIGKLVETAIVDTTLFVGEIKVKQGNLIYVFLDGDEGVTVDDCCKVSRYIENHLDRDKGDFELHVSSFGVGQPLKLIRQYVNAVGKNFAVETVNGKVYKGKLIFADAQKITLEQAAKKKSDPPIQLEWQLKDIKTAKVEVVFNQK